MAEKTIWKLIGKPKPNIPFTTNAFPAFDSSLKATDNYGTWTCLGSGWWDYTSEVWKMLDHSASSHYRHAADSTVANRYAIIDITLPDSIKMMVEEFTVINKMWGGSFVGYFQGYNQETNEWETITNTVGMTYKAVGNVVLPTIVKKYYQKFRVGFYNTKATAGSASNLDIYEIMATKGIIKVL